MTLLQTIILGIVEGLTEFLPVSSTGHLVMAGKLLGVPDSDFQRTFEIAIQLGAIGAVVVMYGKRILHSAHDIRTVLVAFVPTAVIGFVLYSFIKAHLLGNLAVVIVALFVGGIALIVIEYFMRGRSQPHTKLTYTHAFIIGCAQALAVIPGVSRSAATIVGGLALGITREKIVEFSFLLAVPTMLAATGYDLLKNYDTFSSSDIGTLLVGGGVSFVVALLCIAFFLQYVRKHNFIAFGVYRVFIAAVFWMMFY